MNLAVQISNINDGNIEDAVLFIQSKLIMKPKSIRKALGIKNFYFYSENFDLIDWNTFTATFTATPKDLDENFYINSSGGRLSVPYAINGQGVCQYRVLEAGDHILFSSVGNNIDIKSQIDFLLREHFLYLYRVTGEGEGDFNDDFNNDFLI